MGILTEMEKKPAVRRAGNILEKKLGDVIHHWEESRLITKALELKVDKEDKVKLGRWSRADEIKFEKFKLQNKRKLDELGLMM